MAVGSLALCAGLALIAVDSALAQETANYVISVAAPNAQDPNSASSSLKEAVRLAKEKRANGFVGEIDIDFPGGVYRLNETLLLDSSVAAAGQGVLKFRAKKGETVVLSGAQLRRVVAYAGQEIGPDGVTPSHALKDLALLDLDEALDTVARAESPRGSVYPLRPAGLRVYQRGKRLTAARWPKSGFATSHDVVSGGSANSGPQFEIAPEKAKAWSQEPTLWVGGFWGYDWHWETARAHAIDLVSGKISVEPLHQPWPMRKNTRFFFYNALAELTKPGEFYLDLDRKRALLSLLEPASDQTEVEVALLPTLLRVKGAQDIEFDGLMFDKTVSDAIMVDSSSKIRFAECAVSNAGSRGIVVTGGDHVFIERSIVAHTGETAIDLSGGDRNSLTPSAHRVERSIIAFFGEDVKSYRPGVQLSGVGQEVENSWIGEGPHNAIWYSGNDHVIIGNEISHVVTETLDAGAIMAGRDWTARGTTIVGNYFHDIASFDPDHAYDAVVIYLDDFVSQATIDSNVFSNVDQGIFLNSGRDHEVRTNLFVRTRLPAVSIQSLYATEYGNDVLKGGLALKRLTAVPYQSAIYAQKYPNLPQLLSDDPLSPKYNNLVENIFTDAQPFRFLRGADKLVGLEANQTISRGQWKNNATITTMLKSNPVIDADKLGQGIVASASHWRNSFLQLEHISQFPELADLLLRKQ
jgi:hypothetical protein